MKKNARVILSLVIICCSIFLCSCGDKTGLVGKWKVSEYTYAETTYTKDNYPEEYSGYFVGRTFIFYSNKTFKIIDDKTTTASGKWSYDSKNFVISLNYKDTEGTFTLKFIDGQIVDENDKDVGTPYYQKIVYSKIK